MKMAEILLKILNSGKFKDSNPGKVIIGMAEDLHQLKMKDNNNLSSLTNNWIKQALINQILN